MKFFTLLATFMLLVAPLYAQTIQFSEACSANVFTLNQTASVDGRNTYSGDNYTVSWNDTEKRWELSVQLIGSLLLYYNTTASMPNPPQLGFGTWVNESSVCGGINQFDGSGTQTFLPVELTVFKGKVEDGKVLLSWETASERDNKKFEIEQSYDGLKFHKIGVLMGNGTSLEPQAYAFTVEKPQHEIAYYRLKQLDFDGQFEYSNVISVEVKGDGEKVGAFYPNPSKSGRVNLAYSAQHNKVLTISVFDVRGKVVVHQTQRVAEGANNLRLDFARLRAGVYVVRIGDQNNPVHRKLVIE